MFPAIALIIANAIGAVTKTNPKGAWAAWEQLSLLAAPNTPPASRPCFYHFCFIRENGAKDGCQVQVCPYSHAAIADPAPFQAALEKIRRASTAPVCMSLRSVLNAPSA